MLSQSQRERNLDRLEIQYSFIAIWPLDVEHPIGSGQVVHYEPGDIVPAGEWGAAAHNLMEMGRIERLAVNVASLQEVQQAAEVDEVVEYPVHVGAGWYLLSNGDRIRTKALAEQAQKELGE